MPMQPEVTQKPLDPATDRNRPLSFSSESPPSTGNNTHSSSSTSSGSGAGGDSAASTFDPAEAARQQKLGALIVQLGGASEEKVFGSANSAAMAAFREHHVPDLLVINRKEDDAAAHPFVWSKPWTWFSAGPQVSPLLWSQRQRKPVPLDTDVEDGTTPVAATTTTTAAAGTQTDVALEANSLLLKAATAALAEKTKKKKAGLPLVIMNPLTEEEVKGKLTQQVRDDRDKLLKSEERIHKVLQGIEDTRYKYLVPSQDLSCERQVHDIVVCYEKQNAAAGKKRAAIVKQRKAEVAKGFSNRVNDEDLDVPIVLFDALLCGPAVDALKKCTAEMVSSYSEGGLE